MRRGSAAHGNADIDQPIRRGAGNVGHIIAGQHRAEHRFLQRLGQIVHDRLRDFQDAHRRQRRIAQLKHLGLEAEHIVVLFGITFAHQRQQETPHGGARHAGGAGDLAQGHARTRAGEGADHLETARQRVHIVTVADVVGVGCGHYCPVFYLLVAAHPSDETPPMHRNFAASTACGLNGADAECACDGTDAASFEAYMRSPCEQTCHGFGDRQQIGASPARAMTEST